MKKILLALAAVATIFAGCNKGLEDRVSNLENRVSEIEALLTELDVRVKGINTIVSDLQKNVYVTDVKPVEENGDVIGYTLTFTEGEPVTIYHGQKGDIGATGEAGSSLTIDWFDADGEGPEDGDWYWKKEGGNWLIDNEDNKIPAVKPLDFEISEGVLYVKIDGAPAVEVGRVQGEKGDSWFEGLFVNEADGTVTIDVVGTDRDLVLPLAEYFNIVFNLSEVKGYMESQPVNIPYTFVGGAKVSEVTVRVLKSENCQVEIAKYDQVVTITPEAGEGYVDLYAIYNPTGELRAKTISFNADNYFEITNSAYAVSPVGGNVKVPVTTSAEYDLEIDGDWLTYTETTETKAIRKETIVLTAGANATGADRTATVTLRLKGDTKVLGTFEVTQKVLDTKLVGKEYLETYTNSGITYSGTLKFALSDDFSKGVYKVTFCGVDVYADIEGTTLKIYDGKYPRPLTFSDDYSEVTGPSQLSFNNTTISNYTAFLPLGPAVLTEAEAALVGTYDESWTHSGSAAGVAGGMVISASEEASYGQLKVKFLTDGSAYFESYTSLVDGVLTLQIGGQQHSKYSTPYWQPDCPVALTVNADGTITLASHDMLYGLANYVATKAGAQGGGEPSTPSGVTAADLVGTWTEAFCFGEEYVGTLTISETDNESKGQLKVKMLVQSNYYLDCYADLSADGTTLTAKTNGVVYQDGTSHAAESFTSDFVLTVSENGTKLQLSNAPATGWGRTITSYTATKVVETPAVPKPEDLIGTWTEAFCFGEEYVGTLTISETDNESKGQLKVKMLVQSNYYLDCYADLSADGTTLTAKTNGVVYQDGTSYAAESFTSDFVLKVSENGTKLQLSNAPTTGWGRTITSYTATKQ